MPLKHAVVACATAHRLYDKWPNADDDDRNIDRVTAVPPRAGDQCCAAVLQIEEPASLLVPAPFDCFLQ